jgi:hypothetical protein
MGRHCRLMIADCRLTIEKAVWQLLPTFISNRQSARRGGKIGNSHTPESAAILGRTLCGLEARVPGERVQN